MEEKSEVQQTAMPTPAMPATNDASWYTDLGMTAVKVGPKHWALQQVNGDYLKAAQRKARNPRTGQTDDRRLMRVWYDDVVLGEAVMDERGNCTGVKPGTRIPIENLNAPAYNAFEAALTSFLGYLD